MRPPVEVRYRAEKVRKNPTSKTIVRNKFLRFDPDGILDLLR
jgi:hypothetical protein